MDDINSIMTNQQVVLHSPFKIEIHKRTFTNYLEVIITKDGIVKYAVPSHQERLIKLMIEQSNRELSKNDILENIPVEYYCDMILWLCMKTEAIAVWNNRYEGTANNEQIKTLRRLKMHNLYKGEI